jgi:hypothetical protein
MDRDSPQDIAAALELFGLTGKPGRDRLQERCRELLATWHPPRYANLTNNPKKYMQAYQKAEAMTRDIHAAYALLLRWIEETGSP